MINEKTAAVVKQWLEDPSIDEETKQELRALESQPDELEDRFYRELEFGTGGLRGVIGAGSNRMNRYTVGKATQGLAQYILETAQGKEGKPSVIIAHDSRHFSPEFSLEAALVLAANGIVAKLYPSLRTTPQLSFSVRHLEADGGIMVTASHNPPEYNGYKVYNREGGQLVPDEAERVISLVQGVQSFSEIKQITREEAEAQGLIVWLGDEEDEAFIDTVAGLSLGRERLAAGEGDDLQIVFTPLHGTGNLPVRRVLERIGFKNVAVVPEQEQPDGDFPTVKSPNPEEREAFTLAMKLGEELNADLLIGTDPDCDRMGAVVRNKEGKYVVLTGNQSGAIMVDYVLGRLQESGKLPKNGAVIKTIVTSEMGAVIARHYGAEVLNTLTGFKYIGEKMNQFEQTGEHTFLFGYEESYGYLAGTYARDKDAVLASMLIAEAAAYYKSQGKTLYDVLEGLYAQFGTFIERLESRTMKGKDGVAKIQSIMADWRENPPAEVAGVKVVQTLDYAQGIDGLPEENVLKYILEDDSWFVLRPSGTEPKIKVYFAVRGDSLAGAEEAVQRLVAAVTERVDA
ncbi:phospho-sugar mutase [Saccharibacillus sp. CPCC 101409]|uniref:phospho-sugar mutase n=1 Tax=Saccharibacillus sp. CPCC 101409 TaxID=3058041 RepID=UPI0026729F49|nr:phospho-sugar mutase [Saccharibacillus sp. CPCC 101409]MDO3412103.1 phospho-sugar mutase [Saccharibacillus sp. CPCC 101409]